VAARITFKVTGINPGGVNQAQVTFAVTAQIEGGPPGPFNLSPAALQFPLEVGKEFELGDEFSLMIAPKPELQH
jgi:hypothetical protein